MMLADTHRKLGAGSMDLLHVATAIQVRAALAEATLTVVCADRSLGLVAQAAGFPVFNPETNDPAALDSRSN